MPCHFFRDMNYYSLVQAFGDKYQSIIDKSDLGFTIGGQTSKSASFFEHGKRGIGKEIKSSDSNKQMLLGTVLKK